jgi:hypothetical protein
LFIQIKITKIPVLFSGAETHDNICKKKGKKKNFFCLTFPFISYCDEHQVLRILKKIKKNNLLIIRYIRGMSCITMLYKTEDVFILIFRRTGSENKPSAMT